MTYVISDLHGRLSAFHAMLKLIRFSDDDLLFLNGDIIDYGDAPLRLLLDVSYRSNVFPVLGDHEYRARPILSALYGGGAPAKEEDVEYWLEHGGESTLREMEALSDDQRESVLNYLDEIPLFEAVCIENMNHIMVHGGLAHFSPRRRIECYTPEELVLTHAPFGRRYYRNSRILTGHVPTYTLGEWHRGKIVTSPYQIALDCGAAEGIALGCYCMETGEEYYVPIS